MMWVWIVAALAGTVFGTPSPESLKSAISILVDNDLQGTHTARDDGEYIQKRIWM